MTGNTLSELIMMSVKTPETTASSKSAPRNNKADEDSFSGIFQEKMRDVSKTSQRANKAFNKKPLEAASKNTVAADEKPVEKEDPAVKESEDTRKSSGLTDQEKPSAEKVDENDGKDTKKEEKSDTTNATGILNPAAALLESLLAKLAELTSGQTGETATSDESGSDQTVSANPLEMIKNLLDGKMDKIKELLDKIQPESANAEVQPLLDQLKTLLAKVAQVKDSVSMDGNGKITIQLEGGNEDPATLIAQLQSQGREIMDKLKTKLIETGKQAEQKPLAAESETVLLKPVNTNPDTEAQVDASVKPEDVKVEARTQHEPDENSAKAEVAVKTEGKPELSRNQALQDRAVLDAQPQKIDSSSTAKAEKADFHLAEKPLSQTVTSQVMMKVKLMAGENKQEMEISLKPDNLGKMTLKIIHERGEILAKITTESAQVKSILESNMQLLKDSLEKSGFSVQGLNVSVGNGNGGGQAQDQGSRKDGSEAEKKIKDVSAIRSSAASRLMFNQGMAEGSSSIDLSA